MFLECYKGFESVDNDIIFLKIIFELEKLRTDSLARAKARLRVNRNDFTAFFL